MVALVRGVCPVLETPFRPNGEVDLESFNRLVDHMLRVGVRALMFPAFASEFYKLSDTERTALTLRLLERCRLQDGVVVVASVAEHATYHAVQTATRLADSGIDMLNLLPPYVADPNHAHVHEHIAEVLSAVAPLPVLVQYAPAQMGSILTPRDLAEIAFRHPNLTQVKVEVSPAGDFITGLQQLVPRLDAVVGYAGIQLIDALRRGAVGVQPGCSFVEIYLKILARWDRGDIDGATTLHTRLLPYISYWMQGIELMIQAEKTISMRRGLITSETCRRPGRVLDAHELAMIDRFLDEFADDLCG